MAQTVLITLTTTGADTGPFDLYSNTDGFVVPFETGVSKLDLEAGYTSVLVPDSASIVRIQSSNVLCDNFIDLNIFVEYVISGSVNTIVDTPNELQQEITFTITPTPTPGVSVTATFNWELESAIDNGGDVAVAQLIEPDLNTETCVLICTGVGQFDAIFTNGSPTAVITKTGEVSGTGQFNNTRAVVFTEYFDAVITGGTGTVTSTGVATSHTLFIGLP